MKYQVEKLCDLRYVERDMTYQLLVKWKGFDSVENTWEPLPNLIVEVPVLLKNYIRAMDEGSDKDTLMDLMEMRLSKPLKNKKKPTQKSSRKRKRRRE